MRRMLVLGGTGWLGSRIVSAALARGCEVTCLARARTGEPPRGAALVHADRSQPDAYAAVSGEWDEVVDVASVAAFGFSALDALASRAAHWTFVSSVSVYARNDEPQASPCDGARRPVRVNWVA